MAADTTAMSSMQSQSVLIYKWERGDFRKILSVRGRLERRIFSLRLRGFKLHAISLRAAWHG